MIPESPIANEIYQEQTAMHDKAWMVLTCTLIVYLCIVLVRVTNAWIAKYRENRRAQEAAHKAQDDAADADLALAVELSKPECLRSRDWWAAWCERNELPESTRRTLLAGIEEKEAA